MTFRKIAVVRLARLLALSPKARVVSIVAVVCALAAGATVGATLLQTRGESTGTTARKGAPPLDLQVTGPLAQAVSLYSAGKRSEAGAIFARYHSLPAEIGAAFARWPHGSLDAVKKLVASNPQSGLAELHLGLAYYWSGRDADAVASWRNAAKLEPDSPSAVTALDFLHPNVAPGLPPIVVDAASVDPRARTLLLRGILMWDRERPLSAKRDLDAAAALAPRDPAVAVADAMATFSPAHPLRPFPKLGPLTAAFPKAAVVRLHLGVLLLWTRQVAKGKQQLRLAISTEPGSVYASQAKALLRAIAGGGSQ
jgi:tetratricopeptide (TPR) repeat protein